MSLQSRLFAQFGNPRGVGGHLAGFVMSHRPSNLARNRWTADLLEIAASDRVVDFGCGPGLAVAEAAKRAPRGHVVGIDHSAVMCAQARRRNRTAIAEGRVEIRQGGVEQLAALTGRIDKLCALNVVMFLPDKLAAFAAFRDTLRPGGMLAVTHMPRQKRATAADGETAAARIREYMEAAGFTAIADARLPIGALAAVCVRGYRPGA